eukprot:maker-scaffold895_size84271-snap-gene-0.34 protein:Tk08202 transcript:maker-scaffold895_size84271-snap-gene-0.34-mRNA-1 annotation:"hypothetical protein DAPPUDRAFT_329459"
MDAKQIIHGLVLLILLILVTSSHGVFGHERRASKQFYVTQSDPAPLTATKTTPTSLLDTFSLSFAGNFNFANTMEGLSKIMEGISSFIDLSIIRATVDVLMDKFLPSGSGELDFSNDIHGPIPRRDMNVEEFIEKNRRQEDLKQEITTVVGAVLDKQECYQRTACMIGRKASSFAAKDVMFIMAEKIVPSWKYTLDLIKNGSQDALDCAAFTCSPESKEAQRRRN